MPEPRKNQINFFLLISYFLLLNSVSAKDKFSSPCDVFGLDFNDLEARPSVIALGEDHRYGYLTLKCALHIKNYFYELGDRPVVYLEGVQRLKPFYAFNSNRHRELSSELCQPLGDCKGWDDMLAHNEQGMLIYNNDILNLKIHMIDFFFQNSMRQPQELIKNSLTHQTKLRQYCKKFHDDYPNSFESIMRSVFSEYIKAYDHSKSKNSFYANWVNSVKRQIQTEALQSCQDSNNPLDVTRCTYNKRTRRLMAARDASLSMTIDQVHQKKGPHIIIAGRNHIKNVFFDLKKQPREGKARTRAYQMNVTRGR